MSVLPVNLTSNSQEGRLAPAVLSLVLLVLLLGTSAYSQAFPDKIRGYKVHSDKMEVSTVGTGIQSADASVKIGEPKLVEADLTGITFELPAEILAAKQSGKVDFLAFHNVRVNGITVNVEEYRSPFDLSKGEFKALPKPARVFLPATGILQAAWKEMRDSQAEWTVSGRALVFGRFRRFGIYHKRVVPVDFQIKIKNPLSAS
jgi:hypothetical protein